MKYFLFSSFFLFSISTTTSQTVATYKWLDPAKSSTYCIEGQGWQTGLEEPYDRFPNRAEKDVRKPVWDLSKEAAGLIARFSSDADDIIVRYTVSERLQMPHMPATGVSGVDLYSLGKNGKWRWAGGKYHFGDTIEYHFSSLTGGVMRNYYLYLPLYNHVKWMEIGIPESKTIHPISATTEKPIVVYGTSIAQGGVASRPGMAWPAILGRKLKTPVINLGFSGNGMLEENVVKYLAELNPEIYILDCYPNLLSYPADTISERLVKTIKTLQTKRPGVPIIITEDANEGLETLNTKREEDCSRINKISRETYKKLKSSGVKNLYYLSSAEIGFDDESSVEGSHPNDIGMDKYAVAFEKLIRNIRKNPGKN